VSQVFLHYYFNLSHSTDLNGANVKVLHTAQAIEETAATIAKLEARIEQQQSGVSLSFLMSSSITPTRNRLKSI